MAEVDARIVTSAKDCLDIQVFSSIDEFIVYNGYPDQDLIDDTVVMDEMRNVYECRIVNEGLHCSPLPATQENILVIEDRIRKYIKTQSVEDCSLEDLDFNELIEEVVKLRGVTY